MRKIYVLMHFGASMRVGIFILGILIYHLYLCPYSIRPYIYPEVCLAKSERRNDAFQGHTRQEGYGSHKKDINCLFLNIFLSFSLISANFILLVISI